MTSSKVEIIDGATPSVTVIVNGLVISQTGGGGGGGLDNVVEDTSPQLGGNLDVNGFLVDGRDPSADGTKLDGIETGATADQTGAQIKAAYEAELDTNAYDDAAVTKLAGVEAGATADQTGAEIKAAYEGEADTNAYDDAAVSKLAGIEAGATSDQTGSEIKAAYEAEADTNAFTNAEQTKLSGVEAGATADQTGAQIKAAYEAETDTNAYDDAAVTKLAGIEASADVTDEANVTAVLDGATLDDIGSPVATDKVLVRDASDSNALKEADFSEFGGGGDFFPDSTIDNSRINGSTRRALAITPGSTNSNVVVAPGELLLTLGILTGGTPGSLTLQCNTGQTTGNIYVVVYDIDPDDGATGTHLQTWGPFPCTAAGTITLTGQTDAAPVGFKWYGVYGDANNTGNVTLVGYDRRYAGFSWLGDTGVGDDHGLAETGLLTTTPPTDTSGLSYNVSDSTCQPIKIGVGA